jgi:hypothetical protein
VPKEVACVDHLLKEHISVKNGLKGRNLCANPDGKLGHPASGIASPHSGEWSRRSLFLIPKSKKTVRIDKKANQFKKKAK